MLLAPSSDSSACPAYKTPQKPTCRKSNDTRPPFLAAFWMIFILAVVAFTARRMDRSSRHVGRSTASRRAPARTTKMYASLKQQHACPHTPPAHNLVTRSHVRLAETTRHPKSCPPGLVCVSLPCLSSGGVFPLAASGDTQCPDLVRNLPECFGMRHVEGGGAGGGGE